MQGNRNTLTAYLSAQFQEIEPLAFYRDLFPSGALGKRGERIKGRYAGIATCIKQGKKQAHTVNFYDDDFSPIEELINGNDFVVIPPVSYAGKYSGQRYARELYAITFDVDFIKVDDDATPQGLIDLLHQMKQEIAWLPQATYIASSGNGLHVYYLLDKPIRLFENTIEQLRVYRTRLTHKLWNMYVSEASNNPQFESVTQGFRAVGSITKDKKQRVRVFKTGERVSIEYLNKFVPESDQFNSKFGKSRLDEVKLKYPQWYERRIVQRQPRNTWTCKPDLYYWWLRKANEGVVSEGHRYWYVFSLAIYARKCGIPRKQLEHDALSLIYVLDKLTTREDNHFDESDVYKALYAYRASYITFPRAAIEEKTAILIPQNKRNYRKQEVHCYLMRNQRAALNAIGEGHAGNAGRPSKRGIVFEYLDKNPNATYRDVMRDCGISASTACRHMRAYSEKNNDLG